MIARIWQLCAGAYLPLGDDFWAAFEGLQSLILSGQLPTAHVTVPGENGVVIALSVDVRDFVDGCRGGSFSLRAVEQAANPQPVSPDWDELVAALPGQGFGDSTWSRFTEGLFEAAVSGSGSPSVVLAKSATVSEVVVWDSDRGQCVPSFEPFEPVRRVLLAAHLGLGDKFWDGFADVEMATGLKATLSNDDGLTITVLVESVTQRDGLVSWRYTLTRNDIAGG